MNDCDEYFNKKKYLNISFLSNKVKGEYFEYSAINALQDSKIIKLPINYKNIEEVTVNEIVKMNEIESSFDTLIKEYNEQIKNLEDNEGEIDDDTDEDNEDIIEEKDFEEDEYYDDNNNYLYIKNNKLYIDLNKEYKEENLDKEIEGIISNYFLKDFVKNFNEENQKNEIREQYNYLINEEEKEYLKRIKDYKKEIYQKEIKEKKEKILQMIKQEKEKGEKKEKKDNIFKITIAEKSNKKAKKLDSNLREYNGNENFFITQTNPNGELLDYAILFGKRNEKIFLGFQMKCFSPNTSINDKFIEKDSIKKILSPIIINAIKLFNCSIKEWHYFLVFYYNKNEEIIFNVGNKSQSSAFKNNIEFLLFDPNKKKFYAKDKITKIEKLELSFLSNLDNINYINECKNYLCLPKNFSTEKDSDKFDKNYEKGLNQFVLDFKQLSEKPENILKILSDKLNFKNIFYCLSFHFPLIEIPNQNHILLYKKRQNSNFIAIYNDSKIMAFDLENGQKINFSESKKFIDTEYEYTYILKYEKNS